jgi:hypothetical protein
MTPPTTISKEERARLKARAALAQARKATSNV